MRVPVLDLYIGTSLMLYGEWAEAEVQVFRRLVRAGDTVVDAGAHVGSLTLPLARLVGAWQRGEGRISEEGGRGKGLGWGGRGSE